MKAKITLGSSVIELDGDAESVSDAIRNLNGGVPLGHSRKRALKPALKALFDDGFFITPRSLAQIRDELNRREVAFSPVSLFPALYRDFLSRGMLRHSGKRGQFLYHCSPKSVGAKK